MIFEDETVTVQDRHSSAIRVPIGGDGYPSAAMMLWDDSMLEPAVSLAFAANTPERPDAAPPKSSSKADLWHRRLGHPSRDALAHTLALSPQDTTFPKLRLVAQRPGLELYAMCAYAARPS